MLRLFFVLSLLFGLVTDCLATPFSIRCERGGAYFLTFDDETARVVGESPARVDGENRAIKGRIKKTNEDEILFDLLEGGLPRTDFIFRQRQGVVDLLSAAGPSTVLVNCVPASLRAVLSKYDQIGPFD